MSVCDGEPNNKTGSVETHRQLRLALALRVPRALPFTHHEKDNAHRAQTQLHSNNFCVHTIVNLGVALAEKWGIITFIL